jgi:tRNA pseudouridine55 synthase
MHPMTAPIRAEARAPARVLDGWLVIDKAPGMTSAQVVARVRRITGAAKAGHAGALDPLATGVLPVALGEATKTVPFVMDAAKTYRFMVRWGEERDTDDADGRVTQTATLRPTADAIAAALPAFRGLIEQAPPAYSAIKVAGVRAYKLARQGDDVPLAPRPVRIDSFELLERIDDDRARFEVRCGKGTYIRALARDLGRRLNCLAHVVELHRAAVGRFSEAAAFSLDKLAEVWHESDPASILVPVATALADIPALALTGPQADRLRHGQTVRVERVADGRVCATEAGKPIAVADVAAGEVRSVRVFNL